VNMPAIYMYTDGGAYEPNSSTELTHTLRPSVGLLPLFSLINFIQLSFDQTDINPTY
jgi:hypothetical protein